MAVEGIESCGSRVEEFNSTSSLKNRQQKQKMEVYNDIINRLYHMNHEESKQHDFENQLWIHFDRLPLRYALDVNVERAEDVLKHKRLLHLAQDTANNPAFEVRLVQVPPMSIMEATDFTHSDSSMKDDAQSNSNNSSRNGLHPPPTFGSSQNLEALALQVNGHHADNQDSIAEFPRPMHEITFSTVDRPKLLSELTTIVSEAGLNIREAHAFSTTDGFSLDVFVVDGWDQEETAQLRSALDKEILKAKSLSISKLPPSSNVAEQEQAEVKPITDHVPIPPDGDVWEIDPSLLTFGNRVSSGSSGDVYKGTYCGQEVAIKFLKPGQYKQEQLKEFSQEVFIMRKIRHKNVVQFIGACTQSSNLCILTEFMSRGSLHDLIQKRGAFKFHNLIKVAIDVSNGMNYLHRHHVIHRDLKSANLLMDEHEVVKVADFGVSRVQCQSGVMTSETGTYRWMAPEVIQHKPYDNTVDIFSFGIVLWELLTGELPYQYLTPLQAAIGVVQRNLRPTIPKQTHPKFAELLEQCWQQDPALRPNFTQILEKLRQIAKEVGIDGDGHKSIGGFFSGLRKAHH